MDEEFAIKILPLIHVLRMYHSHEVFGLDNIPTKGPAIIATNHSLATYDIMLLMAAVYLHNGRIPRSLIDRAFYVVPGLGELMERLGCIIGNPDNASTLLENGELLYLAPGGMNESLRPSTERYQVKWNRRKGFARLAIETQSPVILAACPHADDIFKVYENSLTKWFYSQFRLPFFVARGVGPTLIPRPVKLEHFLSKPIYPPKMASDPAAVKRQVYNFHKKLTQKMQEMIAQSVVPYKGPQ
jgi:1-acyl-sn-glycerol-3-phosphate acyltransferase